LSPGVYKRPKKTKLPKQKEANILIKEENEEYSKGSGCEVQIQ